MVFGGELLYGIMLQSREYVIPDEEYDEFLILKSPEQVNEIAGMEIFSPDEKTLFGSADGSRLSAVFLFKRLKKQIKKYKVEDCRIN